MQRTKRVAVASGATGGIGMAVARGLADAGFDLALIARNPEKAHALGEELTQKNAAIGVRVYCADLTRMAEVSKVAQAIRADYDRIDVLLQSAGTVPNRIQVTSEGVEETFANSYLSRYVLVRELLPAILASDRKQIVMIAAAGQNGDIRFDDINFTKAKFSATKVVQQFQQANDVLAMELAERYREHGLVVHCLHPGLVDTELHRNWPSFIRFMITKLVGPIMMTRPEEAARVPLDLISGALEPGSTLVSSKGKAIRPAQRLADASYRRQLTDLSERLVAQALTTAV